jgi:hypothetical protein
VKKALKKAKNSSCRLLKKGERVKDTELEPLLPKSTKSVNISGDTNMTENTNNPEATGTEEATVFPMDEDVNTAPNVVSAFSSSSSSSPKNNVEKFLKAGDIYHPLKLHPFNDPTYASNEPYVPHTEARVPRATPGVNQDEFVSDWIRNFPGPPPPSTVREEDWGRLIERDPVERPSPLAMAMAREAHERGQNVKRLGSNDPPKVQFKREVAQLKKGPLAQDDPVLIARRAQMAKEREEWRMKREERREKPKRRMTSGWKDEDDF